MNPQLAIRKAAPADAALLHRWITALAVYEREPDAVKVSVAKLAEQLSAASPPFECFIAESDGVPAGMALFFLTYSTWRGTVGVHLEDLYVEERYRGLGIGAALLAKLAAETVHRGGARLEWAVLDWNEPAMRFYRALGAAPVPGWSIWRLDDAALDALAAEA